MKQLLILGEDYTEIATGTIKDIAQTSEAVTVFVRDIHLEGYTPNHEVEELRAEIHRLKSEAH